MTPDFRVWLHACTPLLPLRRRASRASSASGVHPRAAIAIWLPMKVASPKLVSAARPGAWKESRNCRIGAGTLLRIGASDGMDAGIANQETAVPSLPCGSVAVNSRRAGQPRGRRDFDTATTGAPAWRSRSLDAPERLGPCRIARPTNSGFSHRPGDLGVRGYAAALGSSARRGHSHPLDRV